MGFLSFNAMPLGACALVAGEVGHTEIFDIQDASELYMTLKVIASASTPSVDWEKSNDGQNWTQGGVFSLAGVGIETLEVTSSIYRYLRFKFTYAGAATDTFEISVFTKNNS